MPEMQRNFNSGLSSFVPAMKGAGEFKGVKCYSLGSPDAADDDLLDTDIDADATAGTETAQSWTSDVPYGRTLTMTMSADPGAAAVFDVYGRDYLNQPMIERFTHVNGSAPVIYGKKAFYEVSKVVSVTEAVNAVTCKLGTGHQLGLPYRGQVQQASEGSVYVPVVNTNEWKWVDIDAAAGAAGFTEFVEAPFAGYVKTLKAISAGGGSTNDPVITVELGGTAITGLSVTVDTSASGNEVSDTPTTSGYSANNRFAAGDNIEIVGAAAASAGAFRVGLELQPTQFTAAVYTDPQTATTGDPRGTYEPYGTPNGSTEVLVWMSFDNTVNASGHGGLHGMAHYYA